MNWLVRCPRAREKDWACTHFLTATPSPSPRVPITLLVRKSDERCALAGTRICPAKSEPLSLRYRGERPCGSLASLPEESEWARHSRWPTTVGRTLNDFRQCERFPGGSSGSAIRSNR